MGKAPFIVIEGIDGAGTTTQSLRLLEALRARNVAVHGTREPSDGPVGLLLRQILTGKLASAGEATPLRGKKLALLFAADRMDHLESEVLPRIDAGVCVLSDRYDHSSIAYQSVSERSSDSIPWLRDLNRFATRPDLTLVLDVSADVARARRLARSAEKELFDDDDLQARLAEFYSGIDRYFPEDRIVHVDANRGADEVFEELFSFVLPLFTGGAA